VVAPLEGAPKTVTISHEADGWYAIFSCADVPTQPLPLTGRETGIDVGWKVFLISADGMVVKKPRHHRHAEKRLAKAQRRVSKRQQGSKRYKKAVKQCAKRHQTVKRQRADFYHKVALQLVREYDIIYLEDTPVRNLAQNQRLAKTVSDAGWAQFRTILVFKAACAGNQVMAVPRQGTSQDCRSCGELVLSSLSIRSHVCPFCGLALDRSENAAKNAAKNIQWAGQALRGLAG
jgi:putative transposase